MARLGHTFLLLAALYATDAYAFFRMNCNQPVVVERADSIVSPGVVSNHLHQVLGGNGFNFTETYSGLRASSCSTCQAVADLSNYWTPTLFFHAQNGSFHPVNQIGGGTIYYLQRTGSANEPLFAFPEGFRMLAGDTTLRSFNASSLAQQAISFTCLDYAGSGAGGQWNYLPRHNCPNGVRLQVFFPSCWDGKNIDSADHKSHVAYPDHEDSGDCPSSHPTRLISIFYEIIFDTNPWNGLWWSPPGSGGQPFVLSNGDPTGYGFHGDFYNGWDVPTLQNAIDKCNDNSGNIQDCPVLTLRTDDEMTNCIQAPRVAEQTTGWLKALPGCNPIQPGPGAATVYPNSECGATSAIVPAGQASFLAPAPAGWTALGCAQDTPSRVFPNRWAPGNMTVPACLAHCAAAGYKYCGLEWSQECWFGNSFSTSTLGPYACDMPCQGDQATNCGGSLLLAVYEHVASTTGGGAVNVAPPTPPPQPTTTTTTTPKPAATTKAPAANDGEGDDDQCAKSRIRRRRAHP